jgi:hypothetical protein
MLATGQHGSPAGKHRRRPASLGGRATGVNASLFRKNTTVLRLSAIIAFRQEFDAALGKLEFSGVGL